MKIHKYVKVNKRKFFTKVQGTYSHSCTRQPLVYLSKHKQSLENQQCKLSSSISVFRHFCVNIWSGNFSAFGFACLFVQSKKKQFLLLKFRISDISIANRHQPRKIESSAGGKDTGWITHVIFVARIKRSATWPN